MITRNIYKQYDALNTYRKTRYFSRAQHPPQPSLLLLPSILTSPLPSSPTLSLPSPLPSALPSPLPSLNPISLTHYLYAFEDTDVKIQTLKCFVSCFVKHVGSTSVITSLLKALIQKMEICICSLIEEYREYGSLQNDKYYLESASLHSKYMTVMHMSVPKGPQPMMNFRLFKIYLHKIIELIM